jgi:purine-binding chemotaxis protein CheW
MASLKQFCTFSVDDLLLALDVLEVQEVIRYQEMTRVPTAPAVLRGLINLRGQIVTAIDLRRRLELPPADDDRRPMNVVVRTDDGAVSLLVDEIGDVLQLDEQNCEPAPETIPGAIRNLVAGIYRLPDHLLIVLDPEKVTNLGGGVATLA